jgi:hypothetical protein
MHELNTLVDSQDPLKSGTTLRNGIAINSLGQIVASGLNANGNVRNYLLSPRYKLTKILGPATNSVVVGSTVRIAVGLLGAENVRIPDSRAKLLASAPCRVQIRVSGAQTLAKTCMKYDAATNEFFFNWQVGSAGTGSATVEVRVNYGAPGPLKAIRTKAITITG